MAIHTIFIEVSGGVVQTVYSELGDSVNIKVIDHDNGDVNDDCALENRGLLAIIASEKIPQVY